MDLSAHLQVLNLPPPSLPTTSQSLLFSPESSSSKKRKGSPYKHAAAPTEKRVKRMGRPKNGWTATRKRKLIRLYLMTELDVGEISQVLRAETFQPCKRDIQKQLTFLLQSRPNQVRARGPITKTRLRMLRECKDLSSSKKSKGVAASSSGHSTSSTEPDTTSPLSNYEPISSTSADIDWSWLNFDTVNLPTTVLGSPMMEIPELDVPSDDILSQNSNSTTKLKSEPLTESPENTPKVEILTPDFSRSTPAHYEKIPSEPDYHPGPKPGKANSLFKVKTSDFKDTGSILTTSTTSFRSVISLGSLKKRLQSRYSGSFLHDIKSLMDRLTISEHSDTSSVTTTKTVYYSRRSINRVEDPIVVLAGYLPQYCWEHLNCNELMRCDDLPVPCSQGPIYSPMGLETHRSMRSDVMFRIRGSCVRSDDVECTDCFGNTVLHVAATLGASPNYLSHIIDMGADIHRLNVSGQTFLHLIYLSEMAQISELRFLIATLIPRGFNFLQQDDNGQTIFHALFQSSMAEDIVSECIQCFLYHGITLPKTRDCIGNTVSRQLRRATFSTLPPPAEEFKTYRTASITTNQASLFEDFSCPSDFHLPRPPVSPLIENLQDLQNYELHADLLRTILRATDNPSFEDTGGRNGLHCLAAVRLDLPLPDADGEDESALQRAKDHLSLRERYLEQLLLSGVDPNAYDRSGMTPFMAFVANVREDEDDNMTSKILDRLCHAGANIHRRNRKGETALHIAVKYGRRAATKFLIARGANVHARTSDGTGILSLGLKHSDRASHDDVLYAQISLCISLVAGAGAVSAPTILREWALEDFRIAPDRDLGELPKDISTARAANPSGKGFYGRDKQGPLAAKRGKAWTVGGK